MVSTTPHSTPHSSPNMSDLGCAVDTTGKLLDASEIVFYNDPDDETPISGPGAPPKLSIHPFFSHGAPPARIIAGARHSSHASRPSARLVDPDNAESSTSGKHKVDSSMGDRCVSRNKEGTKSANQLNASGDGDSDDSDEEDLLPLVDVEDFDDEDDAEDDDAPGTEVGDDDEFEAAYLETQAMTIADREVIYSKSFPISFY